MVTSCQIPDVYVTCNLEHDSISLSQHHGQETEEPCEYDHLTVFTGRATVIQRAWVPAEGLRTV